MTVGAWDSRLKESIKLISPMGTAMEAKWIGDDTTIQKRVQRDGYPLVAGETGADLGSLSETTSGSIFFDGIFCDLLAEQFLQACKEVGKWQIVHPVRGLKTLILLKTRQMNKPVERGGVIEFETEWFEPLDLLALIPDAGLAALIASLANSAAAAGALSVDLSMFATGFGDIATALGMASVIGENIKQAIGYASWTATVATSAVDVAKERYDQANNDLSASIAATEADPTEFDPKTLALLLSALAMASTFGNLDGDRVLTKMETAASLLIEKLPDGTRVLTSDANKAYMLQAGLEGVLAAACSGMSYAERQTRAQVIDAARRLAALFSQIVKALDTVSGYFEGLRANKQYYSQTETYQIFRNLVSKTIEFMLRQIFDLAIEKRFNLGEAKTPIQICFEEFKADGEAKFDDFIEWNQLEGDDILYLPPGREVVVYVERIG